MKIFKISCYSHCGTYFNAYLKSIIVLAENAEQAKNIAEKRKGFIYPSKVWKIEELASDFNTPKIIDEDFSSDY